jgi:hypothetical protein
MKKDRNTSKKLALNRETLRYLEESQIREAVGGGTLSGSGGSCQNSCDTITFAACITSKSCSC